MGREFLRPHRIYLSLRNVSFNLFSRHDDVQSSRSGGSIVQRPLNAVMASRTRTTIRDWTSNGASRSPRRPIPDVYRRYMGRRSKGALFRALFRANAETNLAFRRCDCLCGHVRTWLHPAGRTRSLEPSGRHLRGSRTKEPHRVLLQY
jgi:hypothetical protein